MNVFSYDQAIQEACEAVKLSRRPEALTRIRAEILQGIDLFMCEFEAARPAFEDNPRLPRWYELKAELIAARAKLSNYDLHEFADLAHWNDRGDASFAAASLLKMIGHIGK